MEGLLLLLLFPLAWPFIAKRIWHTTVNWQEMGLNIVIPVLLATLVWQLGVYGQTTDHEVWNGQITSKSRVHDTYEDPYDCMCTTDKDGSQSCSTCYETRYTVTWSAKSTVGNIRFKHLDRTSRSVYNESDPVAYKRCKKGQPAAMEKSYTNYVQAVPQSLFNDNSTTAEQFAGKIPAYPRVHSRYKINRVLNVGTKLSTETATLNKDLSESLKRLGATKQANIIVILTEIDDPTYRHAVENAWKGGKKNDIVIFIGVDGNKITWTDTMTWALNSGNEMFHVTMRDGIEEIGTVDTTKLTPFISKTVSGLYDRPHMKDYEYLADEISPPTWVIVLAIIIAIGGSIGLTILFHYKEVDFLQGSGYNSRTRRNRF
jgi:hypothetical protein